jgi:hypothetical protein
MSAHRAKQCHLRFEFRDPPVALGERAGHVGGLKIFKSGVICVFQDPISSCRA